MSSDDGTSAADIISYIGIPLAVLGVVPIFYTFANSIITAANIRRSLRRNAATGSTRSSVLSGIIEVEFPRYSITPVAREDPDYWALNPHPSRLKGGSWTIFNWRKMAIGKKSYRMEYSADVQEPQADVDFSELLSFLIDHGAVPEAKGFKLLNMAGLWTPANTSLLVSANRKESVLRVAFPEDSDGILSLALQWAPGWGKDHGDELPPHWMRLRHGRDTPSEKPLVDQEVRPASSSSESKSLAKEKTEIKETGIVPSGGCVRVHLAMFSGQPILDAVDSTRSTSITPASLPASSLHLQASSISNWLPTFTAALGTLQGYPLYLIHLPSSLTQLSICDALPCGVLVLCSILTEAETPSWATQYNPHEEAQEAHRRFMRQSAASMAERGLPPAQRDAARRIREAQERDEFHQSSSRKLQRDRDRRALREREALESSRLETKVVSEAALRWLWRKDRFGRADGVVESGEDDGRGEREGPWRDLETAAETILYLTVVHADIAESVCCILDRWKAWVGRGGMNQDDLDFVRQGENIKWLCFAVVLMALLKTESTRKESTLALDLQECVRTWKRVRLG